MIQLTQQAMSQAKEGFVQSGGSPFSHAVIDGLISDDLAKRCASEFFDIPAQNFVRYADPDFEYQKLALNKDDLMPSTLRDLVQQLHSPETIKLIEAITGFQCLKVDDGRWGGGLHMTLPEGYLAVHRDFSVLPTSYKGDKQFLRTINLIGYLNPDWSAAWGGELELWSEAGDQCVKRIEPKFNRWVLFDTRKTYHGHPHPYRGKTPRISVAAYYYQEINVPSSEWTSTEYLRLPWREETAEYARKRQERANASKRYSSLL